MFKRKKKKTGVQTPEFRKPTPPPPKPPTSGSNAVKPNPNYVPPASVAKPMIRLYGMRSGDLRDWVKTTAQIGDIAYYHDDISDCDYLYCYHGPDDNPYWEQVDQYYLEKFLKNENKGDEEMEGLNPLTMQCTYKTPCGWCAKWDKKCDRKIPESPILKETLTNKICKSDEDHEWVCCGISTKGSHYRCTKCGAYKTVPYTASTSNYYKGE